MRREVAPEMAAETKEDVKNADWSGLESTTQEVAPPRPRADEKPATWWSRWSKYAGFASARVRREKLLRMMVEQCWDRLNPPLDPEDADIRCGPFHWLDEPQRSLRFPTTLRLTPIVRGPEPERKGYGFYDFRPPEAGQGDGQGAQGRGGARPRHDPAGSAGRRARGGQGGAGPRVRPGPRPGGAAGHLGRAGPDENTARGWASCKTFLEQALQKRPGAPEKEDKEASDGAPATTTGLAPGATRAEIYRNLEQAAHALRDVEPHSPIPYLLLRAVELGRMSFPELMQELVRDSGALTELKREFGIKDAAAPPPPSE